MSEVAETPAPRSFALKPTCSANLAEMMENVGALHATPLPYFWGKNEAFLYPRLYMFC